MGSLIPESEALEFESAAHGESHTWRATREFALLGEILGSFEWGALDLLLFDLPPGAERTVQYAEFLGPRTSFLLVTIPSEVSRGVVARSVAALSKGPNRLLGYVENMSGYYCRDCDAIKPLFASTTPASRSAAWRIPCLGTVPFDPELARHCDRGIPLADLPDTPVGRALDQVAQQLLDRLESATGASAMKFLCVPCDSPMKLQTVGPPERGSLSVVYACPECGYEMAMLTNAYETQVVQSLGVRIGPRPTRRGDGAAAGGRLPVHRDDAGARTARSTGRRGPTAGDRRRSGGRPPPRRGSRTSRVRPPDGADRHRAVRPRARGRSKWTRRSSTRPATSSACEAASSLDR